MQTKIPCVIMRGGTSRGPFFHLADLPGDSATRDAVLLSVMGSPQVVPPHPTPTPTRAKPWMTPKRRYDRPVLTRGVMRRLSPTHETCPGPGDDISHSYQVIW